MLEEMTGQLREEVSECFVYLGACIRSEILEGIELKVFVVWGKK